MSMSGYLAKLNVLPASSSRDSADGTSRRRRNNIVWYTNVLKGMSGMDFTKTFRKFRTFRRKYGLLHTVCAGVGRQYPRFWELVGPAVTWPYAQQYLRHTSPSYLNLGAGSHRIEGMLNVDISPYSDAWIDLSRRLPFNDNSFDFVFSEEVIEHFDKHTSFEALKEVRRILRPNGVARFTTPRLEFFVESFEKSDLLGEHFNWIFYEHGHRYIYTVTSLEAALNAAGFGDVRISSYRDRNSPLGRFDSHPGRFNHPAEMSIYVDAIKG